MNYYTVKPIFNLLKDKSPDDYIQLDEIVRLAKKLKSSKMLDSDECKKYELIIEEIKNNFNDNKKLTCRAIANITHKSIIGQNLYYFTSEHNSKSSRYYYPVDVNNKGRDASVNHLVFYNNIANNNKDSTYSIEKTIDRDSISQKIAENLIYLSDSPQNNNQFLEKTVDSLEEIISKVNKKSKYNSIFHTSCEFFGKSVLIGNMSIDKKRSPEKWGDVSTGNIMLNKDTMRHIMVQETLRHVIQKGSQSIIFYAGAAADLAAAGFYERKKEREIVSQDNIEEQLKIYSSLEKQFNKIKIGDKNVNGSVVCKKTKQHIYVLPKSCGYIIPTIYDLSYVEGFRKGIDLKSIEGDFIKKYTLKDAILRRIETEEDKSVSIDVRGYEKIANTIIPRKLFDAMDKEKRIIHECHKSFYTDIIKALLLKDYENLLWSINKIVDYVMEVDQNQQKNEKIKFLKIYATQYKEKIEKITGHRYFVGNEDKDILHAFLNEFLIKFNYDKLLLNKFKALRAVPQKNGGYMYFKNQDKFYIKIDKPEKPEINGMCYKMLGKDGQYDDYGYPIIAESSAFLWHEYTLPGIFKKLNLSYKKTLLTSSKLSKVIKSYGWEITNPKDELVNRPIINF